MSIPVKSWWTWKVYLWNKIICESPCWESNLIEIWVDVYNYASWSFDCQFVITKEHTHGNTWEVPDSDQIRHTYTSYYSVNRQKVSMLAFWHWYEPWISYTNQFYRNIVEINMDTWDFHQAAYYLNWETTWNLIWEYTWQNDMFKQNNLDVWLWSWDRSYPNSRFKNFYIKRWWQIWKQDNLKSTTLDTSFRSTWWAWSRNPTNDYYEQTTTWSSWYTIWIYINIPYSS